LKRYNKVIAFFFCMFVAATCLLGWSKSVQELTIYAAEEGAPMWKVVKVLLTLNIPIFVSCVLVSIILYGRKIITKLRTSLKAFISSVVASFVLEGAILLGFTQWKDAAENILGIGVTGFLLLLIAGNFKTIKNKIRLIRKTVFIKNVRL
jgi:hypothetical protein